MTVRGQLPEERKPAARPKRRSPHTLPDYRVQVISGKDRGKTGRVLRVEPAKERVYVEQLNMVRSGTRARSRTRARARRPPHSSAA